MSTEPASTPAHDPDGLALRRPDLERGDGAAMWRIARDSGDLEANSEYAYHMLCQYFPESCVVAADASEGGAVGFIGGFRSVESPEAVFVWQIAVAHSHRGRGLAKRMLRELVESNRARGVRYLEATVTTSNEASQRTFRSLSRAFDAPCMETTLFPAERFESGEHEDEILFRIGPIEPDREETRPA